MFLSIIIPTLDEEKYLPMLLHSIEKQSFRDYEIIVADAGSCDKTLDIAKEHHCRVVAGGLPAYGRNKGADIARGNLLLFLDADVVLPKDSLTKVLEEFKKRRLRVAAFQLKPCGGGKFSCLLFNLFYNFPICLLEKLLPHGAMAILIDKATFFEINGFNKEIKLGEDHDLVRRAKKVAKYGVLKSTKIIISERRFQKEGWLKTSLKYFLCELHMIFFGPVKSDFFKYRFGGYSKNKKIRYN